MTDLGDERPRLLDVLSAGPVGVTSHVEVERAREQMLPWLEEQVAEVPLARFRNLRRKRQRQVVVFASGFSLAAAAVFAFMLGTPDLQVGAPDEVIVSGTPAPPKATLIFGRLSSQAGSWTFGQEVALSERLLSGPEGAALKFDGSYQVELLPSTTISFAQPAVKSGQAGDGERRELLLHEGIAKISVLPSPGGERLVVKTGDVLIKAVMSAFTIEVRAEEPSCVRVNDGRMTIVRGAEQVDVEAGETFGCAVPQTKNVEPPSSDIPKRSGPRTTLSQENALLSRALAAESRGDIPAARRAYKELLSKYPRTVFAQDARAGLDRVSR